MPSSLAAAFLPVLAVGAVGDPVQLGDELHRVGRRVPRVLGQAALDEGLQRLVNQGDGNVPGLVLHRQVLEPPGERGLPGQALEEHGRGGVDVGRRSGRLAVPLLGCHVQRGAADGARSPALTATPKSVSLLLPAPSTSTFSGL